MLYGVVLWSTFLEALNAPIQGLVAEQRLLTRSGAPVEAIFLGRLGAVLFSLAVKCLLLVVAAVWYRLVPPWTLALAPLGLVSLLALATGLGIGLGTFNLVYRDVSKLLSTLTTFWFFLSPVYFTVPESGIISIVMRLNPVTHLLDGTRTLATTGLVADPVSWLPILGAPFALLGLAWLWARVSLPVLLERCS